MNSAIKKAALLASVMEPTARRSLVASLPKDVARQIKAEITVVRKNKWDSAVLVSPLFAEMLDGQDRAGDLSVEQLVQLSRLLDSQSYSRLVLSAEMQDADFLLSLLDTRFASEVKSHMRGCSQMPRAVRAAVLQVAQLRLARNPHR